MTRKQRREMMYNRAFGNAAVDEKAVQGFLQYLTTTRELLCKKPYSWGMTRTVWAAKRVYQFASTLKTRVKNLEQVKTCCADYWDYFYQIYFSVENHFYNSNGDNANDIYKRSLYIENFIVKAKNAGRRNKNGWDEVADAIYAKLVDWNPQNNGSGS
jgi:hypothetical protein